MAEIREAFKMPFFQKKKNDNYQTPIEYLRVIDEHISSGQLINDPFYCQHAEGGGLVKRNWCKLGRHIIHNDADFFTEQEFDKTDCIVSNPPFSLIFQILEKLFELDTPFALLVPLQKIAQLKIQSILYDKHIQVIVCDTYTGFHLPDGSPTRCPSQYFCWLTYKFNLESDFIYSTANSPDRTYAKNLKEFLKRKKN